MNRLAPDELERLAKLSEECGEVTQVIGKILRHGYDSSNPTIAHAPDNRELLTKELGDVLAIVNMMINNTELNVNRLNEATNKKLTTSQQWDHHQKLADYDYSYWLSPI